MVTCADWPYVLTSCSGRLGFLGEESQSLPDVQIRCTERYLIDGGGFPDLVTGSGGRTWVAIRGTVVRENSVNGRIDRRPTRHRRSRSKLGKVGSRVNWPRTHRRQRRRVHHCRRQTDLTFGGVVDQSWHASHGLDDAAPVTTGAGFWKDKHRLPSWHCHGVVQTTTMPCTRLVVCDNRVTYWFASCNFELSDDEKDVASRRYEFVMNLQRTRAIGRYGTLGVDARSRRR